MNFTTVCWQEGIPLQLRMHFARQAATVTA